MSDTHVPIADIVKLVKDVNEAGQALENTIGGHGESVIARKRLQHEAKRLVASLEEPNDEVWPRIFQVRVSV